MRVNQLAESLGVTADTVRYYTRIKFLNPAKITVNGYKHYSEAEVQKLRFILSARQLGFSVDDVGEILSVAEKGKTPCPLVRELIATRLVDIEKRLKETLMLRKRMKEALKFWDTQNNKNPTGKMVCHLIESFADEKEKKSEKAAITTGGSKNV